VEKNALFFKSLFYWAVVSDFSISSYNVFLDFFFLLSERTLVEIKALFFKSLCYSVVSDFSISSYNVFLDFFSCF
jgi:hypothetical protein